MSGLYSLLFGPPPPLKILCSSSRYVSNRPVICSPASDRRRLNPIETNGRSPARVAIAVPIALPTKSFKRSVIVRASDPQREEVNSSSNESDRAFLPQEDLNYLWKLGAGSIAGAAAIKYGSILLPELTRPNIWQAMIMVFAPVIVAVVLLIRRSRIEQ